MKAPCRRTPLTRRCFRRTTLAFWYEASGAVALEYGLIAALIIVAILGAIAQLGETLLGLPLQALIDAFANVLS